APEARAAAAWGEARTIADEDVDINAAIGLHGLDLLRRRANDLGAGSPGRPLQLMTHCNAGWLATVDWGTALAPIYQAYEAGVALHVWVSETRPRNQGALTAFELSAHGVPCTVVADNAAGVLMAEGRVDAVIVGCDRVAANGDVANKVGTYLKALAARAHGVPFWVALPSPTFDAQLATGAEIPIERRSAAEVLEVSGRTETGAEVAVTSFSAGVAADNPAFDVTPAALVSAWITDRGVFTAPVALREGLARCEIQ
ncbi:MAG: S-methyl-5-thioribose-1-phosphate isomerase, partial [Casimicrobiaceae bacterium]